MSGVLVGLVVVGFLWAAWRKRRRRSLRWEPETTETMLAHLAGRDLWRGRRWQGRTEDDPWL